MSAGQKRSRWPRNTVIILFVIAFILLVLAELHMSGYCLHTGKRASDDDKIRYAIDYAIKYNSKYVFVRDHLPGSIFNDGKSFPAQNVFKDVDEFISENPDCCAILEHNIGRHNNLSRGLKPASFIERVLGMNFDAIKIVYPGEYLNDQGTLEKSVKAMFIRVNTCGLIINILHDGPPGLPENLAKNYPTDFTSSRYLAAQEEH